MPKPGDKQMFWAVDFDNVENGPYEVEATFTGSDLNLGHYWALSGDELVACSANGEPLDQRALARTETEGYENCIAILKSRIGEMEYAISWLCQQCNAIEKEEKNDA